MAQSEKVIISVELRDKGVKAGLDTAAKASEQAANATRKLTAAEKDENYWASKAGEAEALRAVKTNIAKGKAKELAIETVKLTAATKQGKTQTGLNNAILVEAGRAASDFQYGMQGMANNIGQLTTLMGAHIQTQGGFVASMTELGRSFFGFQGVLIGIQLFISFLPQLEKWYKSLGTNASKFNDAILKTSENTAKSIGNFKIYVKLLRDSNTSEEDRLDLMKKLNEEYPGFNSSILTSSKNQKKQNDEVEKYVKLLKARARAEAAQQQYQEVESRRLEIQREGLKEVSDLGIVTFKQAKARIKQIDDLFAPAQKYEGALKRGILSAIKDDKGFGFAELSEQRQRLKDSLLFNQEELKDLDEQQEFLMGYIDPEQLLGKGVGEVFEFGAEAPVEQLYTKMIGDTESSLKILLDTQDEGQQKLIQSQETYQETRLDKVVKFGDKLKEAQKVLGDIAGLASGFIDAEIQAEEAKTVKINNELRERLNNENLSAEERKKIQLKIAGNDAASAKKKDKLAEKQFKIDKALAISSALVNTYNAATGVMADTKGGFLKRLSAAIPTIAFGLAQVAMIAKQKFVPTATSAPALDAGGGGARGAAVQPPSFNIVGSSNINQLSDAISEAEKTPTRTYVVASDVSTAQELDRNIIESASL
jgi:hypothetical protein